MLKKILSYTERANLVHGCITLKGIEDKIRLKNFNMKKKVITQRMELEKLISVLDKFKEEY